MQPIISMIQAAKLSGSIHTIWMLRPNKTLKIENLRKLGEDRNKRNFWKMDNRSPTSSRAWETTP